MKWVTGKTIDYAIELYSVSHQGSFISKVSRSRADAVCGRRRYKMPGRWLRLDGYTHTLLPRPRELKLAHSNPHDEGKILLARTLLGYVHKVRIRVENQPGRIQQLAPG